MPINETPGKCPFSKIDAGSQRIVDYIRGILRTKYGNDKPKRAFHPKSIGLVEARLTVLPKLDNSLRVGLFKEPGFYKAWVRFSNASPTPSADRKNAIRGMAIKILDVESTEFMDDDTEGRTQDIVLSNSRNFFPGKAKWIPAVVSVGLGPILIKLINLAYILLQTSRGVIAFFKTSIKTPNLLEEKYYSGSPYSFGEQAIKWHARPLKTVTDSMPADPPDNFLRERLINDLSKSAVSFELSVQFSRGETEPIDDTAIIWKTAFVPVATLTLLQQTAIDTAARWEKDEYISFSPGHAMKEHFPLGSVNMVRRYVYRKLSEERRQHPKLEQ